METPLHRNLPPGLRKTHGLVCMHAGRRATFGERFSRRARKQPPLTALTASAYILAARFSPCIVTTAITNHHHHRSRHPNRHPRFVGLRLLSPPVCLVHVGHCLTDTYRARPANCVRPRSSPPCRVRLTPSPPPPLSGRARATMVMITSCRS